MKLSRNSAEEGTVTIKSDREKPGLLVREKSVSWIKRKCRSWLSSCYPPKLRQNDAARAEDLRPVRGQNRAETITNRILQRYILASDR